MWNKIGMWLFPALYWRGRGEGWFACEDMVIKRIKKHYPEQQEKLLYEIIL